MKYLYIKNKRQIISKKNDTNLRYTKLTFILGLAGFISAADNWFISPSLPAIADGFHVPISKAGIILTAYMIPYGIMQPVYGFLSDMCSKAKVLRWIVCGLAVGTAGCALSSSLSILLIWRVIAGFFAAGIIAVSLALIGDTMPNCERQVYVGKFMGIVFLGQGLSSGLGGALTKYFSWRTAFVFFTGAAICTVFFLYKLPNDSPISAQHRFFSQAKEVIFTNKGRIVFPSALLAGFLLLGLYSYLGAFIHDVIGLDYFQVGIIIMFYGFACVIAGSQVGKLVKRVGQKKVILIGGCLALCSSLLLMFFSCWQAVWISTVSLGFGYIFIQSTLATIAFDIVSESRGISSGLIGLCLFSGGGLGTAFSGCLLSQATYRTLWTVMTFGIISFVLIVGKLKFDKI
ncbi:MFS transporter [Clostridium brassicae]|uniref:MFS transporter n=1 Tax=Clostridium brassicae TaxID=2999072 RepID=A0ABT4D8H1_9CLOT|nr:MFS transporter [Clostridium brassicae]MCY6957511.1 MFS transporter [Clostridium brassicae]